MDIERSGSRPSVMGSADTFTGSVRISPLFQAHEPARALGVSVTFEPGARTAWHTHPLGQTLIVTSGWGLVQRWGGHGATATTAMTHIAIVEQQGGKTVDWMEKVSDEEYAAASRLHSQEAK